MLNTFPQCAGKPYRPSNGTEGDIWESNYCHKCAHEKYAHTMDDDDRKCEIYSNMLIYNINETEYPKEIKYNAEGMPHCANWKKWDWRKDDDGNWNDPTPKNPTGDDPNQLIMPFDIWELLGITDELIVTKYAIIEREILTKK